MYSLLKFSCLFVYNLQLVKLESIGQQLKWANLQNISYDSIGRNTEEVVVTSTPLHLLTIFPRNPLYDTREGERAVSPLSFLPLSGPASI